MKKRTVFFSLIVMSLVVASCSEQTGKGPLKSPAVGMALKAPNDAPNKEAAMKNDEAVSHLVQEHWDITAKQLREAIVLDPNLPEAHFNLGLTLDEMGDHSGATEHFQKAKELAPDNPKIVENEILKKHLQM